MLLGRRLDEGHFYGRHRRSRCRCDCFFGGSLLLSHSAIIVDVRYQHQRDHYFEHQRDHYFEHHYIEQLSRNPSAWSSGRL